MNTEEGEIIIAKEQAVIQALDIINNHRQSIVLDERPLRSKLNITKEDVGTWIVSVGILVVMIPIVIIFTPVEYIKQLRNHSRKTLSTSQDN